MKQEALFARRVEMDEAEAEALNPYACLSRDALRRAPDPQAETGHRQHFSLDADRVLHSMAYTRYIDKTQVFSLMDDDHITHRVLHVQLVSKIGRTVGRLLNLNLDLIEAAALGHDIGHPPFGHDGEAFLSEKCQEHGLGPFLHNLQSVRFLDRLENQGRGLNLSLQVLDAVLCHDGEAHPQGLTPRRDKTFADLDEEIALKSRDPKAPVGPMTLEGCVVRLVDTVAYIGRDLEDAIRLGIIQRSQVPEEVSSVLGNSNGTIVYRLVEDLTARSLGQDRMGFSPEIARALGLLKKFNYEFIYNDPRIKGQHHKIRQGYHRLFDYYLLALKQNRTSSRIFEEFLASKHSSYKEDTSQAAMVRDYLAGMTDEFFLRRLGDLIWPRRISPPFGDRRGG